MASPRPVELIGEKMIAFAPLSIMPLMSLFSCCTFDCALVVSSFQPLALADSTWDLVDAIRKGLASFSDWAQPIVSVLKSILPIPRSEPLHIGPYWASTPLGTGVVSFSVPPAARIAAGTPFWSAPTDCETEALGWAAADGEASFPPPPVVWPVLHAARSTRALADRMMEDLRGWTMTTFPCLRWWVTRSRGATPLLRRRRRC